MSAPKRKPVCLTIEQKLEILNSLQLKTMKRNELAEKYKCDYSTIVRIVQQEHKIRSVALENGNTSRKRFRKGNYEELDQAVAIWFRQMRAKNAIISSPMIMEEAKKFAVKLEIPDFEPSNGWLGRWKAKENISFQKFHGEKAAADQSGAAEWIRNVLPALLSDYDPKDVYNADESGLFYRALPRGTFVTYGEKPEGGKMEKDRLTVLFLCNMDGSDKQVFAIGRSKQPHCFRGKKIPLPYYANSRSWMTGALWTKILLNFDKKMMKQKREVILFIDNAPCHRLEEGVVLQNVKLQFLPANTTSIIQPLDQGIIRTFKIHYRQQIVRKQLVALEKGLTLSQFGKTINILEALRLIERSWGLVTSTTIQNCFRKAGFLTAEAEEDPEIVETMQLEIPENEFNDFINCDENLECCGELSTEEIVEEVHLQRGGVEEEEEEEAEEQMLLPPPNRKEALAALTILRSYLEHNNAEMHALEELENQFCTLGASNVVQKKISDFFK